MSSAVLIVDSHPGARHYLSRVLREAFRDQFQLLEADTAAQAREQVREAERARLPLKLILIELDLPDSDGFELLREWQVLDAVKVVATLHLEDDHLFTALHAGADGYLLKDDRPETLIEELRKVPRQQAPLSPRVVRRLLACFRHGQVPHDGRAIASAWPISLASDGHASLESIDVGHALSQREIEILTYVSKGCTIKEIAGLAGIGWFTVNDHIKAIYRKLKVSSRAEAAVVASKRGLV